MLHICRIIIIQLCDALPRAKMTVKRSKSVQTAEFMQLGLSTALFLGFGRFYCVFTAFYCTLKKRSK